MGRTPVFGIPKATKISISKYNFDNRKWSHLAAKRGGVSFRDVLVSIETSLAIRRLMT